MRSGHSYLTVPIPLTICRWGVYSFFFWCVADHNFLVCSHPLCTCIIPHLDSVVKRYFELFFQGRRACYYLPIREVKSFLRLEKVAFVSCVSPTFFQPAGSGSHLYPAHRNTVRSDHGAEVLLALVGTHFSWSPCPPLLYPYCITTWEICQELFSSSWRFLICIRVKLHNDCSPS